MKEAIWKRLGPASGVLFFVLLMTGAGIHGYPDIRPTDSQLGSWLANLNMNTFTAGVYVEVLGIVLIIPFAGWLYVRLRQGKTDATWPAVTMLAGAAAWVAITVQAMGGWMGLADQAAKGVDIRVAQAIDSINQASYDLSGLVLGLTVLAAGFAIVRGGAMARWAGWVGIVAGVVGVASSPLGGGAPLVGILVYLWLFAVACYCTIRPVRPSDAAQGVERSSTAHGFAVRGRI